MGLPVTARRPAAFACCRCCFLISSETHAPPVYPNHAVACFINCKLEPEVDVIQVSNLTKYYGDYAAIHDVSFEVPSGKIVGFLGPNGAGKTTTLRILAGYLTATSGSATIDGLDVFWQPVEVRRRIGYMPENCPLYPEMRVGEYLRFRAGLKGLHGGRCRQRLNYVLQRCWLTDVRRQLVGTLSKGYRQRVGLADALLADPPVLILDEPTAGLDPAKSGPAGR